eukprot:1428279-Ditylum_brightwellii.AAC.1
MNDFHHAKKKLHNLFFVQQCDILQVNLDLLAEWMTQAGLSGGTEAALCAAMEQMLATNAIKKKIFKLDCSPLC